MEKTVKNPSAGISKRSSRDRLTERIMQRYPDRRFESEDDFYDALDEYDAFLSGNYERMVGDQNKLCQLMCSNPKVGAFISDVAEGEDALVACVRYFGRDLLEQSGDEKKMYAVRRANEEFLERTRSYRELENSMRKNVEQSARHIERFMKRKKMDDTAFDEFLERVFHVCRHVFAGDLNTDVLELLYKGLRYDTDLPCAEHAAEIKGRNERIVLSRRDAAGDSLPAMRHRSVSDDEAKDGYRRVRRRNSIWDM